MHVIDESRDGIGIRVRPDAMSEVEDMTRARARLGQHDVDLALQFLGIGEQARPGRDCPAPPSQVRGCGAPHPAGERQSTPMTSTSSARTSSISAEPWLA